jgi:3-oxoacyl-[acyl-carrier protein] reductase
MSFDFSNRCVLVTGAGHGFGRAIAKAFAAAGAQVYACDIVAAEIEALNAEPEPAYEPDRIRAAVVDVGNRAAVAAWVEAIERERGHIDILVNNAGGVCGQTGRPLEEIDDDAWQSIFAVNLNGAFWCAQAVAPSMKRRNWGRIVNISSGAGLGVSLTGIQAYASAKAGQIGLTRQLAHELGPWNITANNVAPGFLRSNPTTEKQWQAMGEQGQQKLLDGIALRRPGTPDDIVYAVMFFASEGAGWISGQVLSVDGGK